MTDIYEDSKNLTKLIADLQQMYDNTKVKSTKIAIMEKILKAYEIKQKVEATIKRHSLF